MKYELPGGATRSQKAPPFHLMPGEGWKRVALRFGEGAEIHGAWNWLQAMQTKDDAKAFCQESYNHMVVHMLHLQKPTSADDDLAAIGWAVEAIAYAENLYGRGFWVEIP